MRAEIAPLTKYGDYRDVDWSECPLAKLRREVFKRQSRRLARRNPRSGWLPDEAHDVVQARLARGDAPSVIALEVGVSVDTVERARRRHAQANQAHG